ncbi:FKBP-type peptidyl-prolyl cis-trans isomerase [Mycetocola spongiae]|uniref:FKBP-type peptidyl-prolyl cis-trans isomerase n=1 Tax=Mycetocola spongiae TaxID=2859226 RepID=UPI001CF16093|nr:FKBP-type peptidyl-prolyl cis-trans isomerase [Mycetocola spongiae]UCR90125.1 FKBP-type peptidyl-prolyl cis-trans isomerase [Mycetocola spongiae]
MKIPSFIALAAATSLLLVGCSSGSGDAATDEASCVPLSAGKEVESAKIDKDFGKVPNISIAKGTKVSTSQARTVVEGKGEKTVSGDIVTANISLYNATTGDATHTSKYDGSDSDVLALDKEKIPAGILAALGCHNIGSRIAVLSTPADMYGEQGYPQLNIGADDSLLIVADIVSVEKPPTDRPLSGEYKDAPTVSFNGEQVPTISLPDTNPPSKLTFEELEAGDGELVQSGDQVTVNYMGMNWRTGLVFDDSYKRGQPATFGSTQVIEGFSKALVDHKVGSKTLVVIPPAEGYGANGNAQADIKGTDTLVFYVEILATTR